ncbi:Uncharacterized protein BP5553_04828 [Venustampulla echinocandica]|uniref:Uncharacterized protein n=1 Tax=Venustampulla echinocandica TaxID=2656787 RepID=A0A370TPE9_9HELO|nr:Uncharacterized protein BP5553_04828 [Venustampulla echinocandica]RDL37395.1 Uncharacterized protein BP5553_04828 [Venustampulla echinocandica]
MATPVKEAPLSGIRHDNVPVKYDPRWYRTARFWKRISVAGSILLSVASLILAAYASLRPENKQVLRAIAVSGIIVNSISVALSALTSLDWKFESTNDRQFAEQLCKIVHIHEGDQIVITRKGLESMAPGP